MGMGSSCRAGNTARGCLLRKLLARLAEDSKHTPPASTLCGDDEVRRRVEQSAEMLANRVTDRVQRLRPSLALVRGQVA